MLKVKDLLKAIVDGKLSDDAVVKIYLDNYCLTTHMSVLCRTNERNVFIEGDTLTINVGNDFELKDFQKGKR